MLSTWYVVCNARYSCTNGFAGSRAAAPGDRRLRRDVPGCLCRGHRVGRARPPLRLFRYVAAGQLKLDELIRAVKGARTGMVRLEDMTDQELCTLAGDFAKVRSRLAAAHEEPSGQQHDQTVRSECDGRGLREHGVVGQPGPPAPGNNYRIFPQELLGESTRRVLGADRLRQRSTSAAGGRISTQLSGTVQGATAATATSCNCSGRKPTTTSCSNPSATASTSPAWACSSTISASGD
jgi:hypothetical protein